MGNKAILIPAFGILAGLTLVGCQSSDSGSPSRLMAKQSTSPLNQPVTGYPYNPSGNKGLAMPNSATGSNTMSPANGVQQASAIQNSPTTSSGASPGSSSAPGPNFDQGGQVVSRPMGIAPSAGPVPPAAPGGYSLPAPSTYTPPANPEIPVRKPGDEH